MAEEEEKQEEVQQPYQGCIIAPKDSAKDPSSLLFFVRRLCPPFFSYQDEAEHSRLHSLRPARHLQLYAPATPQNAQLCPLPFQASSAPSLLYYSCHCFASPPIYTPALFPHPSTHTCILYQAYMLSQMPYPSLFPRILPQRSEGSLPSRSQPSSLSTEIVHFGRNHSDSTSYVSPFTNYS